MQPSPQSATSTLPSPDGGLAQCRRCSYVAYQAMTVAAILLVLVSMWVF
ncbi:MAG: hypothetical protein KGM96_06445 [Acidobacteriota bacterium]|nr:hypothetical protein [Acidobacteriota bacterium]